MPLPPLPPSLGSEVKRAPGDWEVITSDEVGLNLKKGMHQKTFAKRARRLVLLLHRTKRNESH